MLLETLFNAESTTLELLETHLPTPLLTAHTLVLMEEVSVLVEVLPPLELQPPRALPLLLLFPSSLLLL